MSRLFRLCMMCVMCMLLVVPPVYGAAPSKGTVTGTVTNSASGAAVSGASVQFELYNSKTKVYTVVGTVTTGATGAYTYAASAGTYRITYSAPGFVSQQKSQAVSAGVTYTLNAALVPTTGTMNGTVTDSAGGAPIAGAGVEVASQVASGTYSVVANVSTDANGAYTFTGAPGTYRLTFSRTGYTTQQKLQTVAAGVTYTVNCALVAVPAPGTISGTVTDSSGGAPIAGAAVQVASQIATNTYHVVANLTADANGAYTFTGAPGTYRLTFSRTGYVSQVKTQIVAAGSSYTVNCALPPAPGTIIGTVTDSANGAPIAGASVQIASQTASGTYVVVANPTTDANGAYTFTGSPGMYRLTFSATGYVLQEQYQAVTTGATSTVNCALVAATTGGIAGLTLDATNGQPIAGVTVEIESKVGTDTYTHVTTMLTDASGYMYENAAPGEYRLTFSAADYTTQTEYVTVVAGDWTDCWVNLVRTYGIVGGQVSQNSTATPFGIPGATVEIRSRVGTSTYVPMLTITADETGCYTQRLNPGYYQIIFSAAGYLSETRYVNVTAGSEQNVGVRLNAAP